MIMNEERLPQAHNPARVGRETEDGCNQRKTQAHLCTLLTASEGRCSASARVLSPAATVATFYKTKTSRRTARCSRRSRALFETGSTERVVLDDDGWNRTWCLESELDGTAGE
jgi:hypothetical protein